MSRYLTPVKISLLALVSVYVEDVVPSEASVPLLAFILGHVVPSSSVSSHKGRVEAVDIERLESVCAPLASSIPGRSLWDLCLKRVWELNSFDALNVFFDNLHNALRKTRDEIAEHEVQGLELAPTRILLTRTSPLGAFVRRARLEFTRLQFDDCTALWKAFLAFREPTFAAWRRRTPAATRLSFDQDLELLGGDPRIQDILYGDSQGLQAKDPSSSTHDLEALLEFQIDQMQKMGHRLPSEIKARFEEMVQSGVAVPSLSYYIRFLDAWKAGDFPSSFDNLHRYFDYTMHNRDRTFYQYALLNLAILQADFGNNTEAVSAMREAVASARENKDVICLNYSLSWLYHFGKAQPEETAEIQKSGVLGTDREALAFLKSKAKDTGMWSLLSTSYLGEAKLSQTNGESVAGALESLAKASHINVVKDIPGAFGSQMIVESSLYSRLGLRYLAWSRIELFLQCYSQHSSLEDSLQFRCRAAVLLSAKGSHQEAMAMMEAIDPETLRTLRYYQYWIAYVGLLKLRHALHRNHFRAAEHFLADLCASPALNHDVAFTIALLRIDLRLRQQRFPEAMDELEKVLGQKTPHTSDLYQTVKLLILKARIYDRAGVPQKGFSICMRACAMAYEARFLPLLWEGIGALACVLLSLSEFDATARLLSSIVSQVLECEDAELAAQTYAYLADACVGLAGQETAGSVKRKEHLTRALECLEAAFNEYSALEDVAGQCEIMAKRATIMHLNGDLELANDYAAKYLDLRQAAREEQGE